MEKCALKKMGSAWLCSADSAVSVCFLVPAFAVLALKMFSSVRWKLQRKHSIFRKREKNKEKMSNLCESIDSCCFEVFVVASFRVFLLSHQSATRVKLDGRGKLKRGSLQGIPLGLTDQNGFDTSC